MHEFGSEEEPEGGNDDDSTSDTRPAQEYVIPDESGVTPKYHYFTVEDSADAPSLLRKGSCELQLDPVIGGEVRLMLVADAAGSILCRDTTSAWVKPGVPARWKLSWSAVDSTCTVKFTRILEKGSSRR